MATESVGLKLENLANELENDFNEHKRYSDLQPMVLTEELLLRIIETLRDGASSLDGWANGW